MLEEEGEQRDWTDEELDLIVSDYFLMLNDEAAGVPFNKAQHNLLLRNKVDRSKGSIEFKHQNISAVLQQLGLPWIRGYLPAANYQKAIIPAIDSYLSRNPVALHPERNVSVPHFSSRRLPCSCLLSLDGKISSGLCGNLTP
jgi:hypothetical protein